MEQYVEVHLKIPHIFHHRHFRSCCCLLLSESERQLRIQNSEQQGTFTSTHRSEHPSSENFWKLRIWAPTNIGKNLLGKYRYIASAVEIEDKVLMLCRSVPLNWRQGGVMCTCLWWRCWAPFPFGWHSLKRIIHRRLINFVFQQTWHENYCLHSNYVYIWTR
jgi:hypothetical protein